VSNFSDLFMFMSNDAKIRHILIPLHNIMLNNYEFRISENYPVKIKA